MSHFYRAFKKQFEIKSTDVTGPAGAAESSRVVLIWSSMPANQLATLHARLSRTLKRRAPMQSG